MDRSTDRILTSHVGSLPRPDDLLELYRNAPSADLETGLRSAVEDVVERQCSIGVDIINDGEFGKPATEAIDYGPFWFYVWERVSGYEARVIDGPDPATGNRDMVDFPGYYASYEATTLENMDGSAAIGVSVGPLSYQGDALVQRDIANLKAATSHRPPGSVFISSMAAGGDHFQPASEFYASPADEAEALADAMRREYRAITDAGLVVQLDDPWLVDRFATVYSMSNDLTSFRRWAEGHVELINHSLRDIPANQIRLHICWGSWRGPHSSDLPLSEIIDLLLQLNVGLYSVEAANPMHEHEWEAWQGVSLGDKLVMPGVVTHKTNVLEHPEVVAARIIRYAEMVGRENVIAGTDCGMGGRIHPEIAWAKLKALVDGAELASKRLWA